MTEPVIWYISAADSADALDVLQTADKSLTERLHHLNGASVAEWPGFKIRIHAKDGTQLFGDRDHGREIEKIAEKIFRDGLRAGIRLEVQW